MTTKVVNPTLLRSVDAESAVSACANNRGHLIEEMFQIDPAHMNSKKDTVSALTQAVQKIDDCRASLNQFLDDCVTSAVHVYADSTSQSFRRDMFDSLKYRMPVSRIELDMPDILNAQFAARPAMEMWADANSLIANSCGELSSAFDHCLFDMVDRNVFGVLHWHSADVCEYHYFRAVGLIDCTSRYSTRTESRTSWNNARTETWEITARHDSFCEQEFYERHEHHLYDSLVTEWPAEQIRMPSYIRELMSRVPELLRPEVRIVSGEMLREDIKVNKISERSFERSADVFARCIAKGRLVSPAVVIGSTVVAGWSDRDL